MKELSRTGSEDFSGLMWRAVHHLAGGGATFSRDRGRQEGDVTALRHVLVDEFQDFSRMFDALLANLVRLSGASVFAVGDDWQAINGFAGADLAYFTGFTRAFPGASPLTIATNYRSPASVVAVGNAIMRGLGAPARASTSAPGSVLVADPSSDTCTARTTNRFSGDVNTPALLRLLRREAAAGSREVAVLVRQKAPPWRVQDAEAEKAPDTLPAFEAYLRKQCADIPDLAVHVSTAHAYKGREADSVVIADAHDRGYPLLHPAWSFTRLFGDDEQGLLADERRLFYVASTRARRTLVYLASGHPTTFLADEGTRALVSRLDVDTCPPLPSAVGGPVELRVVGGYDVREELKRMGFRWSAPMKVWHRHVSPAQVEEVKRAVEAVLPARATVEVVQP